MEEAQVVVRVVEGREHRLSLKTGSLDGVYDWTEGQREICERKFDGSEAPLTRR